MATGNRAFKKKTAIDTLAAILTDDPPSVGSLNPQVPVPLRWIVDRCLAKDPENRFGNTKDLARDLANIRDHVSEVSSGSLSAVAAKRSFLPWLLGALGVAALAAVSYLAGGLR